MVTGPSDRVPAGLYLQKLRWDGAPSEARCWAEGLQAATMWNYIYTPAEYGPFMPVSRQWDFVKFPVNLDWGYVIFDCKMCLAEAVMMIG